MPHDAYRDIDAVTRLFAMQPRKNKSQRHVRAANCRWLAAERKAQAERDSGIQDRANEPDYRDVVLLDLTRWGGRRWRIEPRLGYVSGRAIDDETGDVRYCATMKQLLHAIADETMRMHGVRRK